MLRARAGAAANERLGATAARAAEGLGRGGGGLGARLQLQLVFSLAPLNPSQQVLDTWAEGLRDRGRPGPALSAPPSLQHPQWTPLPRKLGSLGQTAARMPTRPQAPKAWWGGTGARQPVVVLFSLCALHGWGCHPTRPESVSTCRNTQAAPGITSQRDCSCWLRSWARWSRLEPLSLPFPACAASRSQPQVARR